MTAAEKGGNTWTIIAIVIGAVIIIAAIFAGMYIFLKKRAMKKSIPKTKGKRFRKKSKKR